MLAGQKRGDWFFYHYTQNIEIAMVVSRLGCVTWVCSFNDQVTIKSDRVCISSGTNGLEMETTYCRMHSSSFALLLVYIELYLCISCDAAPSMPLRQGVTLSMAQAYK